MKGNFANIPMHTLLELLPILDNFNSQLPKHDLAARTTVTWNIYYSGWPWANGISEHWSGTGLQDPKILTD